MMFFALCALLSMTPACTPPAPISGYVTRPPDTSILFVYPLVLQPGTAVVVQTRLPRTLGATQCLSLIAPDGMEVSISCGVVESRRVVFEPLVPGKNIVRLELFIGDRLGARRDASICVVGSEDPEACA